MTEVLHFPDIYSGDAGINFSSSYLTIAKATQGTQYTNTLYNTFKKDAAAWDVYLTAYHFLEQGNAATQADHAFQVVGPNTPLALDVEPNLSSHPSILDAEIFIDEYRRLGGKIFLTYLPNWYWWLLGSPDLYGLIERNQWLWSSNYPINGYSDNGPGWLPYGGLNVAVWQYASTINYGGVSNVDFNAFRGTGKQTTLPGVLAEFKSLVTTGKMLQESLWKRDLSP